MRHALKHRIGDHWFFGTYHEPKAPQAGRRIGYFLINTGHAPRAGHGTLMARIADDLCERGAHVFRIDLPGCGDSPGEVPVKEESFWRYLQTGGFDEVTSELARTLAKQHRIDALVSAGMCGGGVVAIMVADRLPDLVVATLLMEPAFVISETERGKAAGGTEYSATRMPGAQKRLIKGLLPPASWRRALAGKSDYTAHLRTVRTLVSRTLRRARGEDLPADVNIVEVRAYRKMLSRGRPSLALNAEGSGTETVFLTVRDRALPKASRRSLTTCSIPRTNHTFTTPGADDVALDQILRWAHEHNLLHA